MNNLKSKVILLFFIVFCVTIYISCKKNQSRKEAIDSEKLVEGKETAIAQKRDIVIKGDVATITTADGKVTKQIIKVPLSKQKLFLSKVGLKGNSKEMPIVIAMPSVSPPNFAVSKKN